MNKKLRSFLLALLILIPAIQSCSKSEDPEPVPPIPPAGKADNRVYFIYMAADNSLGNFGKTNLNDIQRITSLQEIGKGRVIVFYDPSGNEGCDMREYKAGVDGKPTMTMLAQYEDMNTASPATLEFAIEEMKKFATAGGQIVDSYILDMWSHGTSWEPPRSGSSQSAVSIAPLTVIDDKGRYMELEDFARTVEPGLFDAIVFAECYGGSVEMMYLMHDKTDNIIGSAAEMPGEGIAYDKVLPHAFLEDFDYEGFCLSYRNEYDENATMAWFDCSAFTVEFVDIMKEIYASNEYSQLLTRMNATASASNFEVQWYDRNTSYIKKYFDLGDMVNKAFPLGGDLHGRFWAEYNKLVKYAVATQRIWYAIKDLSRFSGMTAYMMLEWSYQYISANNDYRETDWYQAAYLH